MNAYERQTLQALVDAVRDVPVASEQLPAAVATRLHDAYTTAGVLLAATATELEHRFVYLAIGPHVWGKGFNKQSALDNAIRESSTARTHHIIYRVNDPWTRVDEMGNICYAQGSTCEEVARREPKKTKVRR